MGIRDYINWLWVASEGLRGRILRQAVVGVVHVAVSLMYVWTSKQLIDIATSRIEGNIYLFIVAMIACIITQILLSTYVSRQEVESELDMKNRLRHRLFSHMMDSRWASGATLCFRRSERSISLSDCQAGRQRGTDCKSYPDCYGSS